MGHLATPMVALPGILAKFSVVKAQFFGHDSGGRDVGLWNFQDALGTGSQEASLHNGIGVLGQIPEVRRG